MSCGLNGYIIPNQEQKCILCGEWASFIRYEYGDEIINKVKSIRKYGKIIDFWAEYHSDMCIKCVYQEFISYLRDQKLNKLLNND